MIIKFFFDSIRFDRLIPGKFTVIDRAVISLKGEIRNLDICCVLNLRFVCKSLKRVFRKICLTLDVIILFEFNVHARKYVELVSTRWYLF